jgi:Ca2+-binding RTX toxin-like protein
MRTSITAALCAVVACLALSGNAMAAQVAGTNGGDRLNGTSSDDSIKAKGGNDRVRARGGDDRVNAGRGRDKVNAGGGDDTVQARDGSKDAVVCGAGDDTVKLDAGDVIADATEDDSNGSCEDVQRTGAQPETDADDRRGDRHGRDCPGKRDDAGEGEGDPAGGPPQEQA